MGSKYSHHEPASIRDSLRKIPFTLPTNTVSENNKHNYLEILL